MEKKKLLYLAISVNLGIVNLGQKKVLIFAVFDLGLKPKKGLVVDQRL